MESIMVIISIVIAFGITAALGFVIIPWLRKLKFGQTILEIGPSWHKSKQGTPNMGGIMFIIGLCIGDFWGNNIKVTLFSPIEMLKSIIFDI